MIEETKIFKTKNRAPFYLCVEVFNPNEDLALEFSQLFKSKLSSQSLLKPKWGKDKTPFWKRKTIDESATLDELKIGESRVDISKAITIKKKKHN